MIVKLEPNSKPVSVKVRRYTPRQSVFLHSKVKELERIGLVRRNPTSAWACAPLIVPKSGPEEFRFTTDLRPVNKVTVPHIWPMPDLEASLGKLKNKKVFALNDLCQCYWQFLLDADSQECLSFITPEGVVLHVCRMVKEMRYPTVKARYKTCVSIYWTNLCSG